jgi:hypothetical protein
MFIGDVLALTPSNSNNSITKNKGASEFFLKTSSSFCSYLELST